jgi:hypothetical protein
MERKLFLSPREQRICLRKEQKHPSMKTSWTYSFSNKKVINRKSEAMLDLVMDV